MEEFRERGFCVLEAAALPAAAIGALRRELDPWYEDQFAERADGSFGDWWHPGPETEGTGRVAVSNAIKELSPLGSSVAQTTTDFMLQPCMLDFARSALGSTPVLDDVQLAAYPIVGEGDEEVLAAAARLPSAGTFPLTVRQHSGGGLLELRSEREEKMRAKQEAFVQRREAIATWALSTRRAQRSR